MLQDFLLPFIAIALAELGDKTQLAILTLSTKTKRHVPLLLGATLGFAITTGIAVVLGSWIGKFFPYEALKIGAGILFILFGVLIFFSKEEHTDRLVMKNPFITGFITALLMELGDKSQLAAALFGATYEVIPALLGVLSAMFILTLLAVYLGRALRAHSNVLLLHRISAVVFVILGVFTLLG